MAFADMFAPMRNFGATAAATTQAEAARMGAEASQRRAKTAESLAPWNMAATAVQGVGALGGLVQKFMEMEQMRPQREAMTGYYEAMTDRASGPLAIQGNIHKFKGETLLRGRQLNARGEPLDIAAAADTIRMMAGARKVPAPAGAGGLHGAGMFPAHTWDWGDVDPRTRGIAEHEADGLAAWLAQPDAEKLREAKEFQETLASTKLFDAKAMNKAREDFGEAMYAEMLQVNMLHAQQGHMIDMNIPGTSALVMKSLQKINDLGRGFPGKTSPLSQVNQGELENLLGAYEAKRVATLGGGGSLLPPTPQALQTARMMRIAGIPEPGMTEPQEAALSQQGLSQRAEPGSRERVVSLKSTIFTTVEAPGGNADQARLKFSQAAHGGELGSQGEINAKAESVRQSFPDALIRVADGGLEANTPAFNEFMEWMVILRSGYAPSQGGQGPEYAHSMWNLYITEAANRAGVSDGPSFDKFKKRIYKNLGNLAAKHEPITIDEEKIRTEGGMGQVPGAMLGDLSRQQGASEFEATFYSVMGGYAGGVGASEPELRAIQKLLREPERGVARTVEMAESDDQAEEAYEAGVEKRLEKETGGLTATEYIAKRKKEGATEEEIEAEEFRIADIVDPQGARVSRKVGKRMPAENISDSELASLFQVGSASGLIGTDTFYRSTELPAWSVGLNMDSYHDEDEGLSEGLTFGQGLEEAAWQLGPALIGGTALKGGQIGVKALPQIAARIPGAARLAGLGSKVGGVVGPRARATKEALSRLLLTKPNPALAEAGAHYVAPVAGRSLLGGGLSSGQTVLRSLAGRVPNLAGTVAGRVGRTGVPFGKGLTLGEAPGAALRAAVSPGAQTAYNYALAEEAYRKLLHDVGRNLGDDWGSEGTPALWPPILPGGGERRGW